MAHVPLPKRGPTMIPYMLRLAPSASTAVSHPARLHAVGLIDLRVIIIAFLTDGFNSSSKKSSLLEVTSTFDFSANTRLMETNEGCSTKNTSLKFE
eukprot:scaffold63552_cov42-Cyclotella_meneghiniana.AAC.1